MQVTFEYDIKVTSFSPVKHMLNFDMFVEDEIIRNQSVELAKQHPKDVCDKKILRMKIDSENQFVEYSV